MPFSDDIRLNVEFSDQIEQNSTFTDCIAKDLYEDSIQRIFTEPSLTTPLTWDDTTFTWDSTLVTFDQTIK